MINIANSDGSDHEHPMPSEAELTLGFTFGHADQDFARPGPSESRACLSQARTDAR